MAGTPKQMSTIESEHSLRGSSGAGIVLALVTISSFLVPFMSAATNVALPRMGMELHIDAPMLPWVNTSYMLAAAALLLPLGRLADIYSRRRLFVGGTFAFSVVTAATAFAPSAPVLLGMRLLQGAVGAIPLAASMPLLVSTWPPEKRGRALGVNVAGVYSGLSLGPVIGGILTQTSGWQSIFLTTAGLALVVGIAAAIRLPSPNVSPAREPLDIQGALLSAAVLALLMVGLFRLPRVDGALFLLGSAGAAAAFVMREMRAASPLIDVRLFSGNRVFLFSNLAALVNYSATAGVGFLLSLYLQHVRGLSPRQAGLVLVVQPVLMALLSIPAGRLSERIEPRWLASSGMALTTAGMVVLAFLSDSSPMGLVLSVLALQGIAFALFSSPNTNAVMSSVDRSRLGVASATLGTMRSVGQMLSLGICGLLFAAVAGHLPVEQIPSHVFMRVLRIAFGLFATVCFCGIFASSARGRMHS